MDDDRFDELARHWGRGAPRRAVLKGAAGGLLAPALSALGVAGGAAQETGIAACLPNGQRCGPGEDFPCTRCCTNSSQKLPNGQRRCVCKADQRRCERNYECCSGLCCRLQGEGKICIPGLFSCAGRCPERDGSCP